jgi:hypothetical protein
MFRHILCNLKVRYYVHQILLLFPVLSQMDPVHIFLSDFFKISLISDL